jgi:hypothetical protein
MKIIKGGHESSIDDIYNFLQFMCIEHFSGSPYISTINSETIKYKLSESGTF